jgi:hypothetical protein
MCFFAPLISWQCLAMAMKALQCLHGCVLCPTQLLRPDRRVMEGPSATVPSRRPKVRNVQAVQIRNCLPIRGRRASILNHERFRKSQILTRNDYQPVWQCRPIAWAGHDNMDAERSEYQFTPDREEWSPTDSDGMSGYYQQAKKRKPVLAQYEMVKRWVTGFILVYSAIGRGPT